MRVFKMLPQASKSRGERKFVCFVCTKYASVLCVAHTYVCLSTLEKRAKGKASKTHRRKVTGAYLHIFFEV